jgi:hypothetical protein
MLILTFIISGSAFAIHDIEPLFQTDDFMLTVWGYTNVTAGGGAEAKAAQARIRMLGEYGHLRFFMETDLAGLDPTNKANYITQGWLGYNFGKEGLVGDMFADTTIRAGLLMTAAELYLPASYATIPAASMFNPFHHYASGIQVQTMITPRLLFMADVTGPAGLQFNDTERWNSGDLQTSQYLRWDAVKVDERTALELAVSHASSTEFEKIGLTVKASPTENLDWYNGAFRSNIRLPGSKPVTDYGGYTMPDYRFLQIDNKYIGKLDLRVHGVYEKRFGSTEYTGKTIGVSAVLPHDSIFTHFSDSSVTLDVSNSDTKVDGGPNIPDTSVWFRLRLIVH